jgi:hypothetical protein
MVKISAEVLTLPSRTNGRRADHCEILNSFYGVCDYFYGGELALCSRMMSLVKAFRIS